MYGGEWTFDEQNCAISQGWGVFDNTDHGLRIERVGTYFSSDAEAVAFVGTLAVKGYFLAQRAFLYMAWEHSVLDAAEDVVYWSIRDGAAYWSIRGGPYQPAERCILNAG